jgi:plasmid stability protein
VAALSIRNLDDEVKHRLHVRAARHGRSMEAEARAILEDAVAAGADERLNLAQAIRKHFAAVGGVELDIPPRRDVARAADLPEY